MADRAERAAAVDNLRVPPHSVEAEQAVLGGLMLSNEAWDRIADRLAEDDFYRRDHRQIFRAVSELAEKGQPFDVVTLREWLSSRGELEDSGGAGYLISLAKDTPSAANITAYADIVREKSVLRQLIDVGTEITGLAYRPGDQEAKALLEKAEQEVFRIAERGARGQSGFVHIKSALGEALERIDELHEMEGSITGVASGFTDFDKKTAGLQRGDLIIVAGRPSMGKTAFSTNIAEFSAYHGTTVGIFSMEMSAVQLVMRLISSNSRINLHKLRTGDLTEEDWPKLTSAMEMYSRMNIYLDETPSLSPSDLRARARRLKRDKGLGLVIVDYLQLMQVPGTRENRATEISEISRGLKALAKELDVPVIALSQLNRSLEQRPNKRPVMSDLRESGSIEQDADVIVFIYRDEVYNEDSPDKGKAEIIIGKQRNGSTGTVALTFRGEYTRFENFAPDVYAGSWE